MQKLLKSTLVVGLMTTLSRILGLVRDIIIGAMFGPGAGVDAFIVAFRIPNFLRRIFAEGGFSQAFVPVLSEYRERRGQAQVNALVEHTAAVLGACLCVTTVAGVLAAPVLIWIFAPGLQWGPGEADPGGPDVAYYLSLHPVYFADRDGRRHPQYLSSVRRARVYAGTA